MQKVLLVNPPNHRHDSYNLSPPLGLMVLAERAKSYGVDIHILDLDLPKYRLKAEDPPKFIAEAARLIAFHDPDLVGFTSMGVNAHVSLLIAQELRIGYPETRIIAGGPYFSSIASSLKNVAPWIDGICLGEGENDFCFELSKITGGGSSFESNVAARKPHHPFSAYESINLEEYFAGNGRRVLCYEAGRGCVYRCNFCYSPAHYLGARWLEATEVAADFIRLAALGAEHIFVVNDNFINNPKNALQVCRALKQTDLSISWNCYATLPQLSDELIDALAEAKCSSVYLGLDAVSAERQRAFNKRFVRSGCDVLKKIDRLIKAGVSPTCAFIFDLAEYRADELAANFNLAAECGKRGARIRFNALAYYPGTAIVKALQPAQYSEDRPRILLDCPEIVVQNPLAQKFPDLFPFHSHRLINDTLWRQRLQVLWLAQRLIQSHPSYFLELGLTEAQWADIFSALIRQNKFEEGLNIYSKEKYESPSQENQSTI